jgi:hypothetical protein
MLTKVLVVFAILSAGPVAFANETLGEKGSATAHDAKRSMKKTGHRMKEAVCAEGDAKCLAEKAKHRTQEGSDYVKDKASETGDKLD